MLLVGHLLLGFRELRHLRYYEDDPLVRRVLGLKRLPDVSTVSRTPACMDAESVEQLQQCLSGMVLERLQLPALKRVTLDFDGSVIGTGRLIEIFMQR